MHNRLVTQQEANPTLYYTAYEINTFKNVSKSKVQKPLQPHLYLKMAQQLILLKKPCKQVWLQGFVYLGLTHILEVVYFIRIVVQRGIGLLLGY